MYWKEFIKKAEMENPENSGVLMDLEAMNGNIEGMADLSEEGEEYAMMDEGMPDIANMSGEELAILYAKLLEEEASEQNQELGMVGEQ